MNQQILDWLYGLCAPMVVVNKEYGASYTGPFCFPNLEFVDMKDDWGIDSRESLLQCVFRMVDDGLASSLSIYYNIYHHLPEYKWLDFYQNQGDFEKVLLDMVAQTYSECGQGGIKGWDYARMVYVIRNGTTNKYITEQEAIWLLSRIAVRAQYFYNSWENYFSSWFIGRHYWKALDKKDNLPSFRCVLTRSSSIHLITMLKTDQDSPSNLLPWFLDIPNIEKPEALKEYDWS